MKKPQRLAKIEEYFKQHNLPLISLIDVKKKEYITAILAIYELNNPSLLADIYVDNYSRWSERY
jgi:tRNA1(Val) A37 N6-methylase TrmN6